MASTTCPARIATTERERGASLAEYALLVGLVATVCLGALRTLGGSTESSLSSASPAVSAPKGSGGGGGGGGTGGGGGGGGTGSGGTDSAAEEATQAAKEQEAIDAQAAKDAAAAKLATSVSMITDEVGTIYWTAKNGKSAKWEATATLGSEWDDAVVLAVQVTRTFGDGHTTVSSDIEVAVPAGGTTDLTWDGNVVNTNKSVTDDVVTVTFEVVEVRTDDATGDPLTVPADISPAVVDAPPFK